MSSVECYIKLWSFSASDLEMEFAEMRRLGLPTIFINSYLDMEEEEGEEEEAEVCGTVYGFLSGF